jgi:L-seryl-tRNA(Ser) seleniumtransferase
MIQPTVPAPIVNAPQPKDLPALDRLLRDGTVAALVAEHGHSCVTHEARSLLDTLRQQALAGTLAAADVQPQALAQALAMRVAQRLAPRLRTVINLTGTVIHTNLGRALLADSALQHLLAMMAGPNNLEYDLAGGGRGDRDTVVEELLCTLTGAEAATVVNNNAAAVLLTIAALARGQEVIVSRGELVEIGGAFRMPDVMASAGATLVEVGTTNRTHPHDYERAITTRTGLADEDPHQQLCGAGLHRGGGRSRSGAHRACPAVAPGHGSGQRRTGGHVAMGSAA